MKFTIETKTLLRELRLLNLIQSGNTKVPVLSQLRLEVGETLKLTKTDLDYTLICENEITYAELGGCLVNSRLLRDLIATVTDETIDFALTEEKEKIPHLSIVAGKAQWQIETQPIAAFPAIPALEVPALEQRALNISFSLFRDTLARVIFASTNKQSRFTLSGVKFIVNGSMKMITTDGHRLALATVPDITGNIDVLLPLKALNILSRFPQAEEIGIGIGQVIAFEVENRILLCKLLSGNFPNYEMVLPNNHDLAASFDAIAMTHALKQALVTGGENHISKWTLNPTGISDITSENYDSGRFKTEIVTNYKGEKLVFGLNIKYFLDFCSRQSGIVNMTMKDKDSALSFTVGDDYQYVMMPLRI